MSAARSAETSKGHERLLRYCRLAWIERKLTLNRRISEMLLFDVDIPGVLFNPA
jgi:hypothetical protein